jgi:Domain of unknown function (DUF4136)
MKNGKWLRVIAVGFVLAAGLVACSTVTVSSDYDPAADFSHYKTFTVLPLTQFQSNPLTADRIKAAITQALQARGLSPSSGSADLKVSVFAKLSKNTQVTSTGTGYGYGWRWGGGMRSTTIQDVTVGTLAVILVDAATDKPVWQGTASDTIGQSKSGEEKQEALNNAMEKMFAKFPPGAAK